MKKLLVFFCAMFLFVFISSSANASLQTVGTATYLNMNFNLIYENDSIDGGLVWLDYTNSGMLWPDAVEWASGIGSNLTVNLDPGYTTDIDWGTGWRLPITQEQMVGYIHGSEMPHLYYESLGNVAWPDGGSLVHRGDFIYMVAGDYWTGTGAVPDGAWSFGLADGKQDFNTSIATYGNCAMAVRPGNVSAVPIPSAVLLLGSGLIGLVGIRKKFQK